MMAAHANGAAMPDDDRFAGMPDDDDSHEERTRSAVILSGERAASSQWSERIAPCEPEWFSKPPARREWCLVDTRTPKCSGVIPRGKVGLLLAEGGAGKTMVLVQWAIAHATGAPLLGCFTAPIAGRVLVVLGEEDTDEARRRSFNARRAVNARMPEPGSIVMLTLAGVPCTMIETDDRGNATEAPFHAWLRGYITDEGPFDLVLIDPLSRFAGADAEIDNAAATRFVQALESIATATGATVIVAHHTNKTSRGNGATVSGASARGSSAIFDGVRWAAALSTERIKCADADTAERLGELVTFAVVKSNYSRKSEPVLLRRDPDNGGALLPLDDTDREIIAEARADAEPSSRRQAARADEGKARTHATADAVREALRAAPGLSGRALLAAVVARRGQCSRPVLDAAVMSLLASAEIRTAPGPDRSTLHYLAGDAS